MKKIILAIGIAAGSILSIQAQGLIIFSSSTQNMLTNNGIVSGRIVGAGNYDFALFYSASATTVAGNGSTAVQGINAASVLTDGNWIFAGYATNTAVAGRFTSSTPNADGSTTIGTIAAGSAGQFVVLGWSASLGGTLNALETSLATGGTSGFIGSSAVSGSITTGNGGLIPTPNLFGGVAPQLQAFTLGSFTVAAVPEPSTMALAALGGASLLLFRRRK